MNIFGELKIGGEKKEKEHTGFVCSFVFESGGGRQNVSYFTEAFTARTVKP